MYVCIMHSTQIYVRYTIFALRRITDMLHFTIKRVRILGISITNNGVSSIL